jgi:hypothetical protein
LPEKIEALISLMTFVHLGEKPYKAHVRALEKFKEAGVFANDIDTGVIKF